MQALDRVRTASPDPGPGEGGEIVEERIGGMSAARDPNHKGV